MNYLQLCQKLAREAEITQSSSIPSAVTSQTGQLGRVVGWVADAWKDIQNRHPNWRWMRRAFTLNTVASDDSYAYTDATDVDAGGAIARFKSWWAHDDCDQYRCYLQSSGQSAEYHLIHLPWDQWMFLYRLRGGPTANQPVHVSVDHQNNLVLGPKPNAVYVVSGDFQRGVQVLAANGDIPDLPLDHHDLIWRYAIQMYAANSVAPEVYARCDREATRTMLALERNQLPMPGWGGALA